MAKLEIKDLPWRDMASAPRDGTIIAVCYHPWNIKSNPLKIHAAQWLVSGGGLTWEWREPYQPDTKVYADGWLTFEEINKAGLVADYEGTG
jgi:hypothetical protein